MLVHCSDIFAEKFSHLFLGEPDGVMVEMDVEERFTVGALVKDDSVVSGGHSILQNIFAATLAVVSKMEIVAALTTLPPENILFKYLLIAGTLIVNNPANYA
jgi:hypothetical protein